MLRIAVDTISQSFWQKTFPKTLIEKANLNIFYFKSAEPRRNKLLVASVYEAIATSWMRWRIVIVVNGPITGQIYFLWGPVDINWGVAQMVAVMNVGNFAAQAQ